jgi:hypothetical protein
MTPEAVRAAYLATRERVARACDAAQRDPATVTLIAVSKTKPAELLSAAYDAGCRDFGENYAQELSQKAPALPPDIRWHFIGHLQTNKAKLVSKDAGILHTLDSLRLAEALAKHRSAERPLPVLIEVNIGREAQKSGLLPEELAPLLRALSPLAKQLPVQGLMTIPPEARAPEESRPHFAALRRLRDEAQDSLGLALPVLSMGMSADVDIAIQEGATLVRVGTAIFGARG